MKHANHQGQINFSALILIIALFFISSGYFIYTAYKGFREEKNRQILLEKRKAAWKNLEYIIENKTKNFNGQASIVIEDLDSGWQIAINKDKLIPAASLVKIPIMLSYFYAAEEGRVDLKNKVSLRMSEKVAGSKALQDFPAGSSFSIEELFSPMIIQSDNTATNMLIDSLGFDALNVYFKKLGLKNTNISRNMLDFKGRKAGIENYTTAEDMAYLLKMLYCKNFLDGKKSQQCLRILAQQKINDRIPRKLPKGTYIAHKTGLENHVCHDVGIVFTGKGNFLICILVEHKDRFAKPSKKFISDIAFLTYNYYQNL